MELILYLIPTAIVVLTMIVSKMVRGSFTEYIGDLEGKVLEIENVLNLSFMKELLDFFVSSQASKAAERLVNSANDNPNRVSEAVSGAARSSGSEIEKLYGSMKRTLQPSVDLERVKFVSRMINQLIYLYGFSIAAIEYGLISAILFLPFNSLAVTLDGVFFGVTVIFGIFVIVIVIDLVRYSGRIKGAMKKLTGEYSPL
ncbi:MAG: hypothetical protein M1393_03285 [Candidatus Thermoplasmatota archaeon]|jgi:hypothetical protein|nr:hypothetical protein [Candidatus Thermoplasmatota archaeon]